MKKTLLMVGSFLFYVNCGETTIVRYEPNEESGLEDVLGGTMGGDTSIGEDTAHFDSKGSTDSPYTIIPPSYIPPDTTNYETTSNDTNDDSTKITTVEDCVSYVVERLTEWEYTAETNEDNFEINLLDPSIDDYVMVEAQIRVKIPENKIGKINCNSDLYLNCKVPEPEYKGFSSNCKPYYEFTLPKEEAMINYALSKSLEQWLE